MTTHTITIHLTEEAQREAILAGEPAQETQRYELDHGAEAETERFRLLALPWTTIGDDGSAHCHIPTSLGYSLDLLDDPPGTAVDVRKMGGMRVDVRAASRPANFVEALAHVESLACLVQEEVDRKRVEHQKKRAKKERAERERAEEWAALPLDWRATDERSPGTCVPMGAADYRGPLGTTGSGRYDRDVLQKYCPDAWAEAVAETERRRGAKQEAELAVQREGEARVRAWIETHGSDRLKKCVAEDIECGAAFSDEWLAREYPGWRYYCDVDWYTDEPRNPPVKAFEMLERARETCKSAQLRHVKYDREPIYAALATVAQPDGDEYDIVFFDFDEDND